MPLHDRVLAEGEKKKRKAKPPPDPDRFSEMKKKRFRVTEKYR